MKQVNLGKRILRSIFVAILSIMCIGNLYAKNEDTPNLDFSLGNFQNWERYYSYFGPSDFTDFNSANIYTDQVSQSSVPNQEVWTLKNGDGDSYKWESRGGSGKNEVHGTFSVVSGKDNDASMSTCTRALKRTPEGFNTAGIVGSIGKAEILYDYNETNGWKRRAMAEKLVYRFIVTEKSSLLKLCFASVLSEPNTDAGAHFGDEHPGMCLNVTANNGTRVLPCGQYCGDASSNDNTLVALNRSTDGACYTESSSNNLTYKPWTTNIYDLRDFIGSEVVIEGYVHDCLLELYVCNDCGKCNAWGYGITDNSNGVVKGQCYFQNYAQKNMTKRVMAGGHWAYGYLTGETMELRIDVDNCPDPNNPNDKVKITVPEGFGEGHYTWKTSDGVSLVDGSGHPYTNNYAYVNRSEIQDVDYICTIKGDNADCADISISTRIAKEPIVMDFVTSIACYNNVTFTDKSHIAQILQDGKYIEPDTIVSWEWNYVDVKGKNGGQMAKYTIDDIKRAEADGTVESLRNPQKTFLWTSENEGKYNMTLTIKTAKGCTMSFTKDFKVQPQPELQLDGTLAICKGETSQLQVTNYSNPNNTYVWKRCTGINNGVCAGEQELQNSSSAFFNIEGVDANAGYYQVEIIREEDLMEGNVKIGSQQCIYHKDFNVSIKEIPSFDFNNYQTKDGKKYIDICKESTTTITLTDRSNPKLQDKDFTWSNTETGKSVTVGPTDTTMYIVTANGDGCKSVETIWVNVKPLPQLSIEGPNALCQGDQDVFTAKGLTTADEKRTYEWYYNNTKVSTAEDLAVSQATKGIYTYTLKGTNALGCQNSIDKQLIVRENPKPTVPDVAAICEGENVVINVYNADSCQWSKDGGSSFGEMLKVPTESSISEVPTTNTYKLKTYLFYTDTFCTSIQDVNFDINKNPKIEIEGPDGICKGNSISLTAKDTETYPTAIDPSKYKYSWNDVKQTTTATLTASPVATTSYSVLVSNGICEATQSKTIEVYNKPNFAVTPLKSRVCPNEKDTIIAEEGLETYQWYTIHNGTKNFITPDVNMPKNKLDIIITKDTTIYVIGTDNNGCSDTIFTQVTVKPTPTLGQVGPNAICEGSQITIAPTGGDQGTYYWGRKYKNGEEELLGRIEDGDALIDKPSCSNCGEVTYIVYGTKDGCLGSFAKKITLNEQPTVTISGPAVICKGETADLQAESTTKIKSWSWTGMGKNDSKITVSPISDQTYYVVATAETGGCPGNASYTVKVSEKPTLTIEGGDPICAGGTTTLTAVSDNANRYSWSADDSEATFTHPNSSTTDAKLSDVTLVTVTAYNENNCFSYKTKAVLVYQYPEITTDAKPICQGDNVDISADGAATYEWWSGKEQSGTKIGTGTRHTNTNINKNATSYTVYVRGTENNCTSEKEVSIDIKQLPIIEITGKHIYCQGDQIELRADGGVSYQWSNGDEGSVLTTTANSNITSLSVIGTDEFGCSNDSSYTIKVVDLPNISIKTPTSINICKGDTVHLKAQNGDSYQWYTIQELAGNEYGNDQECISNGRCDLIAPIINETQKFVVAGMKVNRATFNGIEESATCKASTEITITARPKPVVAIEGISPICQGTSTNLTASNSENEVIIKSWKWYINDELISGENKSYINTGTLSANATFKAVATSTYECNGESTKNISLHPIFTASIKGEDHVCEDQTIVLSTIVLDENSIDQTDNVKKFTWAPQGGNSSVTNNMTLGETTNFTLTILDPNGCQVEADPKTVEWIPLPKVVIAQNPSSICAGENTVTLTATSNKGNENMKPNDWEWLDGGNGYIKDGSNNNVTTESITLNNLAGSSTYKVKGTDKYGCVSEQEIHVVEVNDAPDLTITGVLTACLNSTIELTASSSRTETIYWTDNNFGNNRATADDVRRVKLTSTGEFTFTAEITGNGCTTTKKHTVKVYDNPSVTLSSENGKDYVCRGNSLKLIATSTLQDGYSWNISSTSEKEVLVTPTSSPTTCIVTVTDENQCTDTAHFDIRIEENPILYINNQTAGDTTVCIDSEVELSAKGLDNTNYTWKKDGTVISEATGNTYSPTIHSLTVYTVEGNNNAGCPGVAKFTTKTKPYPVITASDVNSCKGAISTVKAVGDADYYTWTWTDAQGVEQTTTGSNYSEILTAERVYKVTGTKNKCTSEPIIVHAYITSKPIINITSKNNAGEDPIQMCFKESDELTANGQSDATYTWTTGNGLTSTNNVANITPTSVGMQYYYVNAKDNTTQCEATRKVEVNVNGLPEVALSGDNNICYNTTATVNASGASTYEWKIGTTDVTQADNSQYVGKLTSSTTFAVSGTDENNCKGLPSLWTVDVKEEVVVDWGSPEVCEGEDFPITIKGATSVHWKDNNATTGSSRTLKNIHATTADGYAEYDITAYYNGCPKDTTVKVKVNAAPVITFDASAAGRPTGNADESQICLGETSTIGASTDVPTTLSWNIGGTDNSITETPKTTGTNTYTVKAIAVGGAHCSANKSFKVIINKKPIVKINDETVGKSALCENDELTLKATGASTYKWYSSTDGSAYQDLTPTTSDTYEKNSVSSTTYYKVTGEDDATQCSASATYAVTVNVKPNIEFSHNPVCAGFTSTISLLNRTPNTQYSWSWAKESTPKIEIGNLSNATSVAHTLNENYIYTVNATSKEGCTATEELTAKVNELPSFKVSDNTTICSGEEVTLSATNSDIFTIVWKDKKGTIAHTNGTISVNPTATTTYTAVAKNNTTECEAQKSVIVTVNYLPNPQIEQVGAACVGNSVKLKASVLNTTGLNTYTWYKDPESVKNRTSFATGEEVSFNITEATDPSFTVYLKATNAVGCSREIAYTIVKTDKPTIIPLGDTNRCNDGTEGTIKLSGADQYTWEDGYTGSSRTEILTENTTYRGVATSGACSSTFEVPVIVNQLPNVKIKDIEGHENDTTICLGDQTTLTAYTDAQNPEYSWSTKDDDNTIDVKAATKAAQTYTIYVTDGTTKCKSKAEFKVYVNDLPNVQIDAASDYCTNENITISANNSYKSYKWGYVDTDNQINYYPSETAKDFTTDLAETKTYVLTATDNSTKCSNTGTKTITAKPLPTTAIKTPSVCYGKKAILSVDRGNSKADYYQWPNGDETNTSWTSDASITETTTFKYKAYLDGCWSQEESVTITPNELPEIQLEDVNGNILANGGSFAVCANDNEISIIAKDPKTSADDFDWSWSAGTVSNNNTLTDHPNNQTTYQVTATNAAGCTSTATHTVIIKTPTPIIISGNHKVCEDGAITLDAQGGSNLTWFIDPQPLASDVVYGENNSNVTISNCKENFNVYVQGDDDNQCMSQSDKFDVSVIKKPTLTVTPSADDRKVCVNSSLKLSATGGANVSITWEQGVAGYLDYTYSPDASLVGIQKLKVTGTTQEGCVGEEIINVTVNALPIISIEGDNLCQGTQSTLEAKGTNIQSFRWTGYAEGANPIDITKGGVYYVEGVDNNNCRNTSSIEVTAYDKPNVAITRNNISWTDDHTACENSEIELEAKGKSGLIFTWESNGNNLSSFGDNGGIIKPTITENQSFTVTAKESHTTPQGLLLVCENTAQYDVTKALVPKFTLNIPTVCKGNPSRANVVLQNEAYGTTYNWAWDGNTQQGGTYHDETELNSEVEYTVTGTLGHCESTVTGTASFYDLPTITSISTDPNGTELCLNESKKLTANASSVNGSISIAWSTDKDGSSMFKQGDGSLVIKPTQTGERNYLATVEDEKKCINRESITINVNELPTIEVLGERSVCPNTNANLTVKGDYLVEWYLKGETTPLQTGKSSDPFTPKIESDVTYTVKVSNETTSCSKEQDVTITAKPLPNITFKGETSVCLGGSTEIAIVGNTGGKNYMKQGDAFSTTSVNSVVLKPTKLGENKYDVKIVSSENCETIETIIINAKGLPEITINGEKNGTSEICFKDSKELVANAKFEGQEVTAQFAWNNRATGESNTVTPYVDTKYYVVGKDNNTQCSDTAWHTIKVKALPEVAIAGDDKVCSDSTTTLSIKNYNPNYTYAWVPSGEGESIDVTISNDINEYTVTCHDGSTLNCHNTAVFTISAKPNPVITIAGNNTVCQNDYVTLTASSNLPSSSFSWVENGDTISFLSSTTQKVDKSHSYEVIATKDGCLGREIVTTNFYELPIVKADITNDPKDDNIICYKKTAALSATVTNGYGTPSYAWKSNYIAEEERSSATPTSLELTNTNTPYSFIVEVTDEHMCKAKDTVRVSVRPNPTILISGDNSVCDGFEATLTASGATTYVWSTGETEVTIHPTITKNEDFTVVGKDDYLCEGTSKTYTVNKKENPSLFISGKRDICKGDKTIVTISGAGASDENYEWYYDSEATVQSSIKKNQRELSPSQTATYKIKGTLNGCPTDTTIQIVVHELPELHINGVDNGSDYICVSDNIELNATENENYKYFWSNNETESSITVSPKTTTVFTLEVTDNFVCRSKNTFTVNVSEKPSVKLETSNVACLDSSITIKAVPATNAIPDTYIWNGVNGNNSFNSVISEASNVYTLQTKVKVTDDLTCEDQTSITIAGKENPNINFEWDDNICEGEKVTFKANASNDADLYIWPDGSRSTLTSWAEGMSQNNSSTPYSYKITGINQYASNTGVLNCTQSKEYQVTVHALPVLKIDGPAFICKDADTELTVSETSGMTLSNSDFVWSTGETGLSITVKAPTGEYAEYSVTATNTSETPNRCATTATFKLNGKDNPNFEVDGDLSYCEGTNANLSISGGNNIKSVEWIDITGGKNETISTTNSFTPVINNDMDVKIVVTNADDCEAEKTIKITKKENPTILVTAPTKVCEGTSATMSVSGATTWRWDHTSSLSANLSEMMTEEKTFYVYGTTNGCTTKKTITIGIYELPQIYITTDNGANTQTGEKTTEICYNDEITLTANGASTYLWENIADGNTSSITKAPADETTFVVEGTDVNGCKNSEKITVVVNSLPTFTVPAVTRVCDGASTTITASDPLLSYNWGDSYGTNNYEYTTEVVTADASHTVIAKNNKGCESNPVSYSLVKKPNPDLNITAADYVCYGTATTLSVKDAADALSSYQTSYVWNNDESRQGSTFSSEIITSKTTFTVTGTKEGCSTIQTKDIDIYELPNILINNGDEYAITCNNSNITLYASGSDIDNYKWDNKPGETATTYEFKPTSNGEVHSLWGKDSNGCVNTDNIIVKLQYRPKLHIEGDNEVCEGLITTLTATPNLAGSSYTYEWKNKQNESLGSDDKLNIQITKDTIIYVTAYDNTDLHCDTTVSFEVKMKPNPIVNIIKMDSVVCKTNYATIIASGDAESYRWKYREAVVSETSRLYHEIRRDNSEFHLFATKNGCTSEQILNVKGILLPIVKLENVSICYNDEVELVTNEGLVSYTWENLTTQSTIESSTSNKLVVSPKITSTYKVTASNDIHCFNSAVATVNVKPLPQINLKADKNACENQIVTISTEVDTLTYSWEDHGDTYESVFFHEYTMGSYPDTSKFVIYAKSEMGCVDSTIVKIKAKPSPALQLTFDSAVCFGKTATMAGLNPLVRYTWSSNGEVLSNNSSYTTPGLETEYESFNVTGIMDGCPADSSFKIYTRQLPNIKIEGSHPTVICRDNSIELMVSQPTKGWSYKWDNNAYKENDSIYLVYPIKPTKYTLFGKDTFGCENKDTMTVLLQERPTFSIEGISEICVNNEATLNATNDQLRYIWYNSHNDSIGTTMGSEPLKINITQDTSLIVRGITRDGLACEETATHSIQANPYPVISIARADKAVCYNTQAYIEVKTDIDATYKWDRDNRTERYVQEVITTNNTRFIVEATSTSKTQCSTKDTIYVEMYELPIITSKDTAICYGDTAVLHAYSENDVTFRWNEATENGADFKTPTLTSMTKYSVKGTDEHGCIGETSAMVYINTLPQFTLSSNGPICRGSEATITAKASDVLSYVWEDDRDGAFAETNEFIHSIGQDTTFTVWAKDQNECKSKKDITVRVKEYPVLSLRMDNDTVCYNESRTIYVTGANNGYLWNDNSTYNYLRLENVTERVEVYVEGTTNGCTSRIDTAIKVWALPTIEIEKVDPICLYQSTQLKAVGGAEGSYKWSTGETTDSIIVTPAKSGITTYSVNGSDIHGCKNKNSIDVMVNALPVVSIEGTANVCRGTEANLEAKAPTAERYEWKVEGVSIEDSNHSTFEPTIENDEYTYWVVVEDGNGCIDSASYNVKAKEFPVLTHKTNTGRDSVCYDGTIVIYVSGADSYKWFDGSEENSFSATLTEPKTFTLEGTTNGCTTPYSITIDTLHLPVFAIDAKDAICLNDDVVLSVGKNLTENRTGDLDYKWRHNGETSASITEVPMTDKTFYVSGTDEYGCKSTFSHTVKVNPLPTDLKIEGEKAVCMNEEVTLTATSATAIKYDWLLDEEGSDTLKYDIDHISAIIDSDTTFYVLATDGNGCKYTKSYDVAKIDKPIITLIADEFVCYGSKTTISVKGATSYVWKNDGSTKNYRTDVITQDTIFSVVGIANGCQMENSIDIYVRQLPNIKITTSNADSKEESNEICKGQGRINLTGVGGVTGKYVWSTKETKDNIVVSPANTTTYSVVGEDRYGCQNSADTVVVVHPIPVVTIEGVNEMCEKDSFELVAKSTDAFEIVDYSWTGYPDFDGKETLKAIVTSDKTFYVRVTDVHNCYNDASHRVDAKAYPVLTLEAPSYVCYGNSAIISAKGASTYKWVSEKDVTQRSFVDIPQKDTTYVVHGTSNGCTSIDSIMVMVKELPNIEIESEGGINSICINDSIVLKGKGGETYTWNTGASSNQIVVHPLVETEYTVIGKDANGCTNNAEFTVAVNALPVFSIKGKELVCEGDVDTLWIDGDVATYTWVSHSDFVGDTLEHAINNDTIFRVKATNENGCVSYQTKTVKTKKYPNVFINAPLAVCDGSVATLTATGAATYVWEDGRTNNSISDTITEAKTYVVYGTTNGCTTEKSAIVRKWDLPNVKISGQRNEMCFGQSIYLQASGASSYIWSNGSTQSGVSVSPTTTTDYILIGKSINNCESRDTFTVKVNSLPKVIIDGDPTVCENERGLLIAKGATSYAWTNGEQGDTIRPIITSTQNFTVVGTDDNGCSATAVKQVKKKNKPIITYTAPNAICKGKNASITVLGAVSYTWEDGSTGNILNVMPEEETTYKVIGNTDGCVDSINITIGIMELPDVTISGTDQVCINDPVTLTATGAETYIWSTGLQSNILKTTPLSSTTYSVTGKDANGCESTVKHMVNVNPLPNFAIKGDKAVCKGEEATIYGESVSGEIYTYEWSWSEDGEDQTRKDQFVKAIIDKKTAFSVIAQDKNGCQSTQSTIVNSKEYPTISFAAPSMVCQNEGITITAFGANEYKWKNGTVTNQLVDTQSEPGIVTYEVTGTTDGCSTTNTVDVTVKEKPQVFIDGETTICSGDALTLSASGAKYYEWNNGISDESIKTYPAISTTYKVKGTNENGCVDTTSIFITVNPKPNFDIISDDEICAEQELTIMASGEGKTYYWGYGDKNYDDNITFNNAPIDILISRPTYIFVKAIDNKGCTSEKFKQIKTITPPSIYYTGETDICEGSKVSLVGQGGDTFVWKLGDHKTAGPMFTFQPTQDTTLTLTGTLGLCSSTINIGITMKSVPELEIIGKTAICKGETTTLTANGAVSYIWNTGETTRSIAHSIKNSMNYTVVGTGYNGCSSSESVTVTINPLPNVKIHKDYVKGCPEVGTDIKLSASGADEFIWRSNPKDLNINGVTDDHIEATLFDETIITVIGTDEIGCANADTMIIIPEEFAPSIYQVTPKVIEDKNPIISMDGQYPETDNWTWDAGDGSKEIYGKNVTYRYPEVYQDSFNVTVKAVDKDGCTYRGKTTVYVWKDFWAPNAFTPNGDDLNNTFRFVGTEFITSMHFIIYNRIGTIVFEGNSKEDEWDGIDQDGNKCPEGVYGYVVTYKSDFEGLHKSGEKKGTITLIR